MLGDQGHHRGQIEDLAGDDLGHRGGGQTSTAFTTVVRMVVHNQVRVCHLGQVFAGVARLFPRLLPRTDPAGLGRGFGVAVARGRLQRFCGSCSDGIAAEHCPPSGPAPWLRGWPTDRPGRPGRTSARRSGPPTRRRGAPRRAQREGPGVGIPHGTGAVVCPGGGPSGQGLNSYAVADNLANFKISSTLTGAPHHRRASSTKLLSGGPRSICMVFIVVEPLDPVQPVDADRSEATRTGTFGMLEQHPHSERVTSSPS